MKGMIYMAFSSHRKQFKGQLANISVSMLNELNYDMDKYDTYVTNEGLKYSFIDCIKKQ